MINRYSWDEDDCVNISEIIIEKGGPGSGNYGHAGRPGKRGGSAPKSGLGAALSIRTGKHADQRQRAASGKEPEKWVEQGNTTYTLDEELGQHYKFTETQATAFELYSSSKSAPLSNLYDDAPPGVMEGEVYGGKAPVYKQINDALRNDRYHTLSEPLKNVHAVMIDKFNRGETLPHNTIMYRGYNGRKKLEIGTTIMDKGFSSATISKYVADNYAGDGYLIRIRAPKGTKGAYIGKVSDYGSEKEFLLPPNTKLNIFDITQDDLTSSVTSATRWIIDAEIEQ